MENEDESRALLRRYGVATAPGALRKDAAWAAIAVAVGGGVGGGGSAAPPTRIGWLAKVVSVAAIAAVGGAAWIGGGEPMADRTPGGEVRAAAPVVSERSSAPADTQSELEAPREEPILPADPAEPPRTRRSVERAAPSPTASDDRPDIAEGVPSVEAPTDARETGTLGAELAILHEARRRLRGGDPAGALGRLDEHQARFPSGTLARERGVMRVGLLCDLRRDTEARSLAAQLDGTSTTPVVARALSRCAPASR